MLYSYPAIFRREDGRYWVEFPDLPGCFSEGYTVKEVLINAKESMELYLEPDEPFESPLDFPEPTDINTLEAPKDGFLSYVTTDVATDAGYHQSVDGLIPKPPASTVLVMF